ncbi:hypothetical protein [Armatimonas rosea]|uniref:Type II toxin-antitoxin system RelE/ParE family toxin n=1 Tax=Armatimonas rosea TaxID=685828 RepID=A0A7W9SR45_ARMRO|nr:hypothetical protein [Armatimonas rosea]MBB6051262.1 hypothetical protein [Armatimonas rosea]
MEELPRYRIRFSVQAGQDAVEIAHSLLEFSESPEAARTLHSLFYNEAGKLSTLPDRYMVQERESARWGVPVRRILVRRWHLYYSVDSEGPDGPLVTILFFWPAMAEPIEEEQLRQIRRNQ